MKQVYSLKAAVLGFRSAWNVAIAAYMSDQPLQVKKKKVPFDQSKLNYPADCKIGIKLFKMVERQAQVVVKVPRCKNRSRDIVKYRQDRAGLEWDWWKERALSSC